MKMLELYDTTNQILPVTQSTACESGDFSNSSLPVSTINLIKNNVFVYDEYVLLENIIICE